MLSLSIPFSHPSTELGVGVRAEEGAGGQGTAFKSFCTQKVLSLYSVFHLLCLTDSQYNSSVLTPLYVITSVSQVTLQNGQLILHRLMFPLHPHTLLLQPQILSHFSIWKSWLLLSEVSRHCPSLRGSTFSLLLKTGSPKDTLPRQPSWWGWLCSQCPSFHWAWQWGKVHLSCCFLPLPDLSPSLLPKNIQL